MIYDDDKNCTQNAPFCVKFVHFQDSHLELSLAADDSASLSQASLSGAPLGEGEKLRFFFKNLDLLFHFKLSI